MGKTTTKMYSKCPDEIPRRYPHLNQEIDPIREKKDAPKPKAGPGENEEIRYIEMGRRYATYAILRNDAKNIQRPIA